MPWYYDEDEQDLQKLRSNGDTGWRERADGRCIKKKVGRRTLFGKCDRCGGSLRQLDTWSDPYPQYPKTKPYRLAGSTCSAVLGEKFICLNCGRVKDNWEI